MPIEFLDEEPAAQPRSIGASGSFEPPKSWLSSAGDYFSEALASLNPKTIYQGVKQAVSHPLDTTEGLINAQTDLALKAEESFKAGDYATGTRHVINALIPLLGPRLDEGGNLIQKGEFAKGYGALTDVAGQVALPVGLSKIKSARTPGLRNPNPVIAEAVDFADKSGIPIDAATATGNRAIGMGQHLIDRSIGGSLVAEKLEANKAAQLTRVGNELAERSSPFSPSAEQAGAAVNKSLEDLISSFHQEADKHYSAVRAAEVNPANATTVTTSRPSKILSPTGQPLNVPVQTKVPLMVDLAPTKAVLRPIFDRLQRQYSVTIQELSPGFRALQNIVEGPDTGPLSQVDLDLGALKGIARGADLPELKSISQGLAAKSVRELSDAVLDAAAKAGTKVVDSLERGREATRAKYETRGIWDRIKNEPVKAFNQMVLPKDGGIQLLSEVNRLTPTEIPKIGRAFLDNLLDQANVDGGFGKRGTIANRWENLGPETKKILYKDPAYIKDLDNFFRYAKMSGGNPNPSGTAGTLLTAAQGAWIYRNPLTAVPAEIAAAVVSKLAHSPRGVRLLTKGLKIPLGNKAAALTAFTELQSEISRLEESQK